MITPLVVKVIFVKLVWSSVLMSCAFLKSWRKEVFVPSLVVFAKLNVVMSVKAAAKSSDFIKLFFKTVFDFFVVRASPGMPEYSPAECQLFAFVENQ